MTNFKHDTNSLGAFQELLKSLDWVNKEDALDLLWEAWQAEVINGQWVAGYTLYNDQGMITLVVRFHRGKDEVLLRYSAL